MPTMVNCVRSSKRDYNVSDLPVFSFWSLKPASLEEVFMMNTLFVSKIFEMPHLYIQYQLTRRKCHADISNFPRLYERPGENFDPHCLIMRTCKDIRKKQALNWISGNVADMTVYLLRRFFFLDKTPWIIRGGGRYIQSVLPESSILQGQPLHAWVPVESA